MGNHHFAMVSEWMDNGNINEFVKARRDLNRFNLVLSYSYLQLPSSLMITDDPF